MPSPRTAIGPLRIRRTVGGTLFRIALEELGDAEQWDRIAKLNGLTDPWLVGSYNLSIPRPLPPPNTTGSVSGRQ
jgi:hypothetical protein